MRHAFTIILAAMGLAFAFLSGASAAELLDVRFGPDKAKTRVVFDIAGAPVFSIAGDDLGAGRLIIDFDNFSAPPAALSAQGGKGHIDSYQFFARPGGGVRAVLIFRETARIKENFLIEPAGKVKKHRLVIDLESADKNAFLASLPTRYPDLGAVIEQATADVGDQRAQPSRTGKEVRAPSNSGAKRVIVVDAGHGGHDPGAQGQSGTLEKHVTLKAALTLKEVLEKSGGYEVILTRGKTDDPNVLRDRRKELARREKLARGAKADLFISLHADALAHKAVRGGSVYTLNEKGSERSAQLAKQEGNYRIGGFDAAEYGEEIGTILFDVAQNRTKTKSSIFAQILLDELTGKTPLLNKSHRTADLRVLLAPDVPAVLFEMAYISNAKDEANLNSPAWRSRTMGAVADAIEAYFADVDGRRFAANNAPETN